MVTPENEKVIQLLKSLVSLNEDLKNQETQFKANCKRQLIDLKEKIEKLRNEMYEKFLFSFSDQNLVNQKKKQWSKKLFNKIWTKCQNFVN